MGRAESDVRVNATLNAGAAAAAAAVVLNTEPDARMIVEYFDSSVSVQLQTVKVHRGNDGTLQRGKTWNASAAAAEYGTGGDVVRVETKVVGNAHKERKKGVRELGQTEELNKTHMRNAVVVAVVAVAVAVDRDVWRRAGAVWVSHPVVMTSGEWEDMLA